jgi:hypothetical protein
VEEKVKTCAKCKETFSFIPEDVFWDEHGSGYSTRLVRCSKCGCINVIGHVEDYGTDVNNDMRFYEYSKK